MKLNTFELLKLSTSPLLLCRMSMHSQTSHHVNEHLLLRYVPKYKKPDSSELDRFNEFISKSKRLFVISGAGLSTQSGIPDYRSEGVGLYARKNHKPMEFADFLRSSANRQRYWARNYVGWPVFSSFRPNLNHFILAKWESNLIHHHVTQNVDSLLIKAGSKKITELHGSAARVVCLDCNNRLSREAMQILIESENPNWHTFTNLDNDVVDSDAHIMDEEKIRRFVLPKCPKCKNDKLKPEIVFFGDNVPKPIVETVNQKLTQSDSLLVVGSTLHVYSSYRIVLQAEKLKIPIAIVNIGKTRGDALANLKIETILSEVLQSVNNKV